MQTTALVVVRPPRLTSPVVNGYWFPVPRLIATPFLTRPSRLGIGFVVVCSPVPLGLRLFDEVMRTLLL